SFLLNQNKGAVPLDPDQFCQLDDTDVVAAIKSWCHHPDKILSLLCNGILNRNLLKVKLQSTPISPEDVNKRKKSIMERLNINGKDASYLVFTGEAVNRTYNPYNEKINILFKDGKVKDISQVDNALIQHSLSGAVKKFYICYLK